MGLFNALKTNKAIDVLVSGLHPSSLEFKEAFHDLKQAGPSAIDKLIDAFDESYPNPALEALLLNQLNNKTLKKYIDALTDDRKRIVAGVTSVMCQSNRYDPNKLLELLHDQDIPKVALLKKDGYTPKLIAEKIGIHPYAAQKMSKQTVGKSTAYLKSALGLALDLELDLKSKRVKASERIEQFVFQLMELENK